jgi:sterol desaturase/sphingolipid hydroxylase (fatty acid hydroxylase superfamily)
MSSLATIGAILATMGVVACVEVVIPLHAWGRRRRDHLVPNLALTFLTFATNAVMNGGLVLALDWTGTRGAGLLHALALGPATTTIVAVVALDLSFYGVHVAMHRSPLLWRFHRVHHADPMVDVTTTIRQHPGESVIRYAAMAACAIPLGVGPSAFALYRAWSALNGLLEHANVRAPARVDRLLALVTTWPHLHKVHHSRRATETDTNYGNLLSLWDRLFATYTPSARGARVVFGLDGFDDPATQSTAGLLGLPFRRRAAADETTTGSPVAARTGRA